MSCSKLAIFYMLSVNFAYFYLWAYFYSLTYSFFIPFSFICSDICWSRALISFCSYSILYCSFYLYLFALFIVDFCSISILLTAFIFLYFYSDNFIYLFANSCFSYFICFSYSGIFLSYLPIYFAYFVMFDNKEDFSEISDSYSTILVSNTSNS